MKKFYMGLLISLLISGCGGGDSSDSKNSTTYIEWSGSSNGAVVVDATNDSFRFEYSSGLMVFGGTTITNVWVDDDADLYFEGDVIGSVSYIKSTGGATITGLISNSGYMIDFFGPESSLQWQVSGVFPVFDGVSSASSQQVFSSFAQEMNTKSISIESGVLDEPNVIRENKVNPTYGYAIEAE